MKKNGKKELQSRREFFKKAAKGALPILGAVVLAGVPSILKAAEKTHNGCNRDCWCACGDGCTGGCRRGCGGCSYGCYNSCKRGCLGTCRHGCKTSNMY